MLATASFLPIVRAYLRSCGIEVETRDISLAGRVIAYFSDLLPNKLKQEDDLAFLSEVVKMPEANIIKLPNISASVPQLKSLICELQSQGYPLPSYPEDPQTEEEKQIKSRYAKALGSAVNPVLREGNSDRRVASAVKEYAKNNPHSMGAWNKNSKTHVAHMSQGDFYGSEKAWIAPSATEVKIILEKDNGEVQILKEGIKLQEKELIDASVMSCSLLRDFYAQQMDLARKEDVLLSLHLKATMMKVSDPIMFGHAVEVYFQDAIHKHQRTLDQLGVNFKNGLGDLYSKIATDSQYQEILKDFEACYHSRPRLAMVDSQKGITNLHVPSDVIIDASMPAMIRNSGKMWGANGQEDDTKALIPDRCYAGIYQETIEFCKEYGAFDPKTMGNVSNIGLMAKKAQEYGSHDKTFEIPQNGVIKVLHSNGSVLIEHSVYKGDIWRMCQTKDDAIVDWVGLAVKRSKLTSFPAIFWLDKNRAGDQLLIQKVESYLSNYDTKGLVIKIMPPDQACRFTLERVKKGEDTISVTGNVLRDYLTDLFPILELGTSAKMLSIVPLLKGGGLYETGAGGSAPKHVQQLINENHLRWDSLGEFLALAASLEDLGLKTNNPMIKVLAKCLDQANSEFLKHDKSPSRKVGELDNRGSHFYLALYWAKELAHQKESKKLNALFTPVFEEMSKKEKLITEQLKQVQGMSVNLGGHYHPDEDKVSKVMRPSPDFNAIINKLGGVA